MFFEYFCIFLLENLFFFSANRGIAAALGSCGRRGRTGRFDNSAEPSHRRFSAAGEFSRLGVIPKMGGEVR